MYHCGKGWGEWEGCVCAQRDLMGTLSTSHSAFLWSQNCDQKKKKWNLFLKWSVYWLAHRKHSINVSYKFYYSHHYVITSSSLGRHSVKCYRWIVANMVALSPFRLLGWAPGLIIQEKFPPSNPIPPFPLCVCGPQACSSCLLPHTGLSTVIMCFPASLLHTTPLQSALEQRWSSHLSASPAPTLKSGTKVKPIKVLLDK